MQHLGELNGRQIFYIKPDVDANWFEELPTVNWLAIPIGDDCNVELYSKLAHKCIANNVVYICTLGQDCELIYAIFDDEIVNNQIAKGEGVASENDIENAPMTTWHNNFDEGFWFALTTAFDGYKVIDKVVCIDYTRGVKSYLTELLNKFHQEWLPSDDEIKLPEYDG